jgi:hypothetical protein
VGTFVNTSSTPLRGLPLLTMIVGSVGALIISIVCAASWDHPWWLLAGPVVILVNVVYISVVRRRAFRGHEAEYTGRTVTPEHATAARPIPATWTGGANIAGALGRMNATMPLAVLEVTAEKLTLRVRPAPIAAVFGTKPFTAEVSSVAEVFPVRGRLATKGVGILVNDQPVAYFWTTQTRGVLLSLANVGYPVSWQEQRAHIW